MLAVLKIGRACQISGRPCPKSSRWNLGVKAREVGLASAETARHMTNTDFIVREKNVGDHFTLPSARQSGASLFGVLDGALVLGFMAAFLGLIFLLAK